MPQFVLTLMFSVSLSPVPEDWCGQGTPREAKRWRCFHRSSNTVASCFLRALIAKHCAVRCSCFVVVHGSAPMDFTLAWASCQFNVCSELVRLLFVTAMAPASSTSCDVYSPSVLRRWPSVPTEGAVQHWRCPVVLNRMCYYECATFLLTCQRPQACHI
ncbi:hypothetical protein TRVL_09735 [Trypanosoma vivax]|nr:hypothetical protein TRVL_09735 [Trypanosoma vivax]